MRILDDPFVGDVPAMPELIFKGSMSAENRARVCATYATIWVMGMGGCNGDDIGAYVGQRVCIVVKMAKRLGLELPTKKHHAFYHTWANQLDRCDNPKNPNWSDYGGRGISMFEPWRTDFWLWLAYIEAYLGPKPTPRHSMDRNNNDRGYEPGNLQWATVEEQNQNRRRALCRKGLHADIPDNVRLNKHGARRCGPCEKEYERLRREARLGR